MEIVKIITPTTVIEKKSDDVNAEMVGQKAMGLLNMPLCWRLPFFVIHKDVYHFYQNNSIEERKSILKFVVAKIQEEVRDWSFPSGIPIIIRSSGSSEGMKERGKYESATCQLDDAYDTLIALYDCLIERSEEGIAYIVQPFVERKEYGHLSNERRVSRTARDWKLEYENSDSPVISLGIRMWRKSYEENYLTRTPLTCALKKDIKNTLRKVAYHFYTGERKTERWHFEFVWNGEQIYIVQNDLEECDETTENPLDFPIQIDRGEYLGKLNVLRLVSEEDGKKYKKVQNVLLYKRLGLTVAPLYILDDRATIVSLTQGIIDLALEQDIRHLVQKSIVIRTDVNFSESPEAQLLPRSNELRGFEDVMLWFQDKLPIVLQYQCVALIIHIFIPSVSAAFAYATPKSRIVTVHSLWGLPEGLYYNAHDTFLMDTGTRNVQHIDVDKVLILDTEADYKGVYIAPDQDGKWKEKKTRPPYDWHKSITDQQAKIIAKGSRMIAQEAGIPLSIMWFVGIDENYYQANCLPWYHERYGNNTFSHETYKKKYFTEREVAITNEEDLKEYEKDDTLRSITIHPKDDDTLRNGDFIGKVGEFAKRKGITIFLEGTVLAHPVYQLMAQGVHVVLAKKSKELIDQAQFNKLVRDKIPDKIIGNMEKIKCYKVHDDIKIQYLKEKLIEEAYEVFDASNSEEKCKEFADLYEVLSAIRKECRIYKARRLTVSRSKRLFNDQSDVFIASMEDAVLLLAETEREILISDKKVTWSLERMRQNIEVEIKVTVDFLSAPDDAKHTSMDSYLQGKYIELAYAILDERDLQKIITLCDVLEQTVFYEISALQISKKKFLEIYNRKREVNGGFDEGFVLGNTAISTDEGDSALENSQLWLDVENTEEYFELRDLLFDPVTYIDYRENEKKELIIRIKYPLCFESWSNDFTGTAVENMFGKYKKLIVKAKRKGIYYSFQLYVRESGYEQLSLLDG